MDRGEFQSIVDGLTVAYMTNDYDTYRGNFALPLMLVAPGGLVEVGTEDAVREMFDNYCEGIELHSIDNTIRLVVSFDDCLDGTYLSTVETHFFSGGQRIAEPHRSAFLVRDTEDGPRIISIMGTRNPQEAIAIAPTVKGEQT
ncbi:hypothetical protein [Celeribacter arenosi]|uniref:SnoaL-like domain-containing protein n=1 Tax=Celeribacter arenosi TaxID=792649 RepID=A0ABP7K3V5_9RHOB